MAISIDTSKNKINDFLKSNKVGVLATADKKGVPHAATIYFIADTELSFFFVTKEKTTKHKNLQQNSNVSLAVYDAKSQTTLQIDGKATLIEDMKQFMDRFNKLLKVSLDTGDSPRPPVSKLYAGNYFMYKLQPKQIRLAEYMKPDHGDFGSLFEVVKP